MTSLRTRVGQLLHRLRSGSVEFNIRPHQKQLQRINALEERFRACGDDQLQRAAHGMASHQKLLELLNS